MRKPVIYLVLLLIAAVSGAAGAEERTGIIREELYFDGYSYSRRYFIETGPGRPREIAWYAGKKGTAFTPGYFKNEPLARGPGCFVGPGGVDWLSCIVTGPDGSTEAESISMSRQVPSAPEPGLEEVFLTFPRPGMTVNLRGEVTEIRAPAEESAVFLNSSGEYRFYRLDSPGYYSFSVDSDDGPSLYNVFVSPVDSVHTERIDTDWYYTQFRTSTTSNCGPTVVSMAAAWARGQDVPVSRVRQILGWRGTGAVSFEEMQHILALYGVDSEIEKLDNPDQIFSAIGRDRLVGVLYDMAGISYQPNPGGSMFDQYYMDKGGHYLAIKGYSRDRNYFIIYDPIPSDWKSNAERYSDGMSMYGRNRYYRVDELMASLRDKRILVIKRPPGSRAALLLN